MCGGKLIVGGVADGFGVLWVWFLNFGFCVWEECEKGVNGLFFFAK